MRRSLCPECGQPLDRDMARAHAENHWFTTNPNDPKLSEEAQRRFKLLLGFANSKPQPDALQPPTNDKAVLGFCELFALFFGLPAGEAFYRGEPITMRMIAFAIAGSIFAILGPTWPYVKSTFPRRISATFVRTASDFRWWMVVILIGFIGTAILDSSGRISPKSGQVIGYLNNFGTGELVSGSPPTSPQSPQPPQTAPSAQVAASTNPSVKDWRNLAPSPWGGPFGPIMAVEIVQTFEELPKPCVVKVTAPPENENLRGTLNWILQYGAKCDIAENPIGPPNVDEPQSAEVQPNGNPGIIIHWAADYSWGENAAHFFDSSSFKVSISHRLPPNSNPHLIWIDIGPGSPWKNL